MTKELFDHFRQLTNYPEEWKLVELKELIYDLRGGSPLEPEDFLEKGFPVLHKGAIKPFGEIEIDPKKKAFTHDAFVKKYSKSVVTRGYLAVTLRDLIPSGPSIGLMSNLYSSPYPEYILAQGAYGFLVDKERVCPEYLVWLSNTDDYRKFIRTLAVGSTQIHVRTPVFTAIPIPLPPLAEQKRIAAIAQKAARLRRTRRYALQLSNTYLRSVFVEMFGDPITNSMGWDVSRLEEHTKLVSSGSTPLGGSTVYKNYGIRFVRSQNVLMNSLDFSDIAYIDKKTHQSMKRTWVQQGDILLNITGASIGRVAYYSDATMANVNQHVCIIRLDKKSIIPIFLSSLISLPEFQRKIFSAQSGATRQALTFDQIKDFVIIVPPLPLQEKFAQIVQKFDRLRTQQREAYRQAEHLFQTLLHRAFRGELTSQYADDEPESVLLEDIRAQQAKAEAKAKTATQAMGDAADYVGTKAKQQDIEAIQLKFPGFE